MESEIKAALRREFRKRPRIKVLSYIPIAGAESGTPDYIGMASVTVTPDMVGKKVALFFGIEVKRPGKKLRPLQAYRKKEYRRYGARIFRVSSVLQFRRIYYKIFMEGKHAKRKTKKCAS